MSGTQPRADCVGAWDGGGIRLQHALSAAPSREGQAAAEPSYPLGQRWSTEVWQLWSGGHQCQVEKQSRGSWPPTPTLPRLASSLPSPRARLPSPFRS